MKMAMIGAGSFVLIQVTLIVLSIILILRMGAVLEQTKHKDTYDKSRIRSRLRLQRNDE